MHVFSVSEFIQYLNDILFELAPYNNLGVEGEVANYKVSQNKWVWFDLKDKDGLINCFAVVWELKEPLEEGMKIRAFGFPKVHQKSGRFSLNVKRVELAGEGGLKRAFEILKKKLADEGLFAPERKRPLPRFPAKIGLITSPEAAAYTDFLRILDNRWAGIEVDCWPTAVQGAAAEEEIVAAFRWFNGRASDYDVLVLTRGGGSLEDLQAFNSEAVARAVYASKIPVVCGVGHERDETLCDYVADVRAATPSNAAELVAPERREVLSELSFASERLTDDLDFALKDRAHRLDQLFHLLESRARQPLEQTRRLMAGLASHFDGFIFKLDKYQQTIAGAERLFANLNPRRLLERGFSIVRSKKGLVRRASEVDIGEEIMVELSQGQLGAEVNKRF